MSQKNYSPVQVRNPSSLQHLAVMKPGQSLELHLDREMYPGNLNVEISGSHLILNHIDHEQKRNVYHIDHDVFVQDWGAFSQSLLGEVWIDSKDRLSKLLVVMDCITTEKMKHFTIVNPDCYDVRVKPQTIIEVVLFNEDFSGNDEWNWEWHPTIDLDIEEIGYSSLNLYTWNQFASYTADSPSHPYARHPRHEISKDCNPWMKQHHFWFRFNNTMLDVLDSNFGVNRVGDLKFIGYSNRYRKHDTETNSYNMSVYVDLKSKFKTAFLDTLHVHKHDGLSQEPFSGKSYSAVAQSEVSVVHLTKSKKDKKKDKKYKRQPLLPLQKNVAINKLPFDLLEEGCKVLSCSPEMDQIPDEEDSYGYDGCDGFDDCHRSGGLWKKLYRHGVGRPEHWD